MPLYSFFLFTVAYVCLAYVFLAGVFLDGVPFLDVFLVFVFFRLCNVYSMCDFFKNVKQIAVNVLSFYEALTL